MSARERAVAAALGAVGSRYRLHGREPRFGLDCVGLVALALRAAGCMDPVPTGYSLRGGAAADVIAMVERDALVRTGAPMPGDVLLFEAGPVQLHLAIKSERGFVHADSMLRRVVERPDPAPWPLIAAWAPVDEPAPAGAIVCP